MRLAIEALGASVGCPALQRPPRAFKPQERLEDYFKLWCRTSSRKVKMFGGALLKIQTTVIGGVVARKF